MSGFLLCPDEVAELTGTPRVTLQLEWLAANGYRAELGRDGRAKVLRAAVEAKMMPSQGRARPKTEPRLDLLRKTG